MSLESAPDSTAYRAEVVFPVDDRPIAGGVVTVQSGAIVAVGTDAPGPGCKVHDLGAVALLPALVNAHTHLEFSGLRQPLPCTSFAAWIRRVMDYRASRGHAIGAIDGDVRHGLAECAAGGTVLVGEIATTDWMTRPGDRAADVVCFHELISTDPARNELVLARAEALCRHELPPWIRHGLSPHAPYSTNLELIRAAARLSTTLQCPCAMHLAETPEELELLASHSGPLHELLCDLRLWHPDSVPRGIRTVDYLEVLSAAHRVLVIHGNYLNQADLDFVAGHGEQFSIVYCPRTQAYFQHAPYPLAEMLARGINVALGTDSRASNPDLDMWSELCFLAASGDNVIPVEQLLRVATLNGARALGYEAECGSIRPGKRAHMVAVRLSASGTDMHARLFGPESRVCARIVAGRLETSAEG